LEQTATHYTSTQSCGSYTGSAIPNAVFGYVLLNILTGRPGPLTQVLSEPKAAQLSGLFFGNAMRQQQHLENLAHPFWRDKVLELKRNFGSLLRQAT
jgi:hypothetical protein